MTVELTEADARAFVEWRKYQDQFTVILASGIMDIREGSAEIHFDPQGDIGAIKVHGTVYKKDPTAAVLVIHRSRVDNIATPSP